MLQFRITFVLSNDFYIKFRYCFAGQRLRNLEVSIGMSLSSMQVCGYYKGPGSNGEMIPISCREPIEARYVKVMIKDENTLDTILNFAEIQVFS